MQTIPYDIKPQARFRTVDYALRWLVWTRPDAPKSLDLSRVSIGRDASRLSRDEAIATRSTLLAMMGNLTEQERIALGMRAADHSFVEIGRELGVSGKAAARRCESGRAKMADRMRAVGLIDRDVA